jgi:hypothetical protein
VESWQRGAVAVLQRGQRRWQVVVAADGKERQLTSHDGNGVSHRQRRRTAASGGSSSGGGRRAVGDAIDKQGGGGRGIILCML